MKYLILLLPLFIAAKCSDLPYPPPPTELCGSSIDGSELICNDPRLDQDKQDYNRSLKKGDLCTNPDDFSLLRQDNINLRLKIYKLEKSCKL